MNYQTTSLCPVCFQRIPATYAVRDEVYLEKSCPEHGSFTTKVWDHPDGFQAWLRTTPAQAPTGQLKPIKEGCPLDCGICQAHEQASCCVLLEVTSRCNLNCPICFAEAGTDSSQDPDLSTIRSWYQMLLDQGGPFNIQLSGGEPTMRDDLAEIISLGKQMGFTFFQLNTNGLRLAAEPAYLKSLVDAGLNTVFLQFDSLNPATSIAMRGQDLIDIKEEVIRQCQTVGVGVVLVPTLRADINLEEVGILVQFAIRHMPTVRGVHFQPISFFGRYDPQIRQAAKVAIPKVLAALEQQTGGRMKAAHFSSGSAEHSLCTFYADYLIDGDVWTAKAQANNCCNPQTSQQARDVVAAKWSSPIQLTTSKTSTSFNVQSLDEFLMAKQNKTLAISGMAFQDAWSIDLERLKRCHVHVVSPKGELVPFCAYNLTSESSQALYRR